MSTSDVPSVFISFLREIGNLVLLTISVAGFYTLLKGDLILFPKLAELLYLSSLYPS